MRRIALLLSALAIGSVAQAQLTLTGTSYTQNFDNIGTGLPIGWEVDSNATATGKGIGIAYDTTKTNWSNSTTTNGKFRNYAAKGSLPWNETTANQALATNRALGVRQVGTLDSQLAFTLQIANTTGLSNFNLSFNLMSLDSTSPRVTTWRVDYGFGAVPSTFTAATATGTLTTGGNTFSQSTINVNFGTALNNQTGPVWLRIVALNKTTGSGNRATTGIDDFNLTWTGAGGPNYRPVITGKTPANNATNVALTDPVTVTFDRKVTGNAAGSFRIKNRTDNTTQTIAGNLVTVAGNTVTVPGVTLLNSKTYHVTFDSTAVDTAGYKSYGSYDTTAWVFTTAAPPVGTLTSLNETFDASCPNLPAGWSRENVAGTGQQWQCYETPSGSGNYVMRMNGFSGGNNVNEDWLITPKLNVSAAATPKLVFKLWKRFAGTEAAVMLSTDYTGTGAPSAATWTNLNTIAVSPQDTSFYKLFVQDLNAYKAQPFYLAFRYISTATDGYDVRLDSVVVNNITTGIGSIGSTANTLPVQVLGNATNGHVMVGFSLENSAALKVAIYDLAGRVVYMDTPRGVKGKNTLVLAPQTLQSGMYIIRVSDGTQQGIARTFIQ